jgi:hypothetical protein
VAAASSRRFYVILDASGSMAAELDGRQKFDIARDAVASLIREMPDGTEVALRVYGHRKGVLDPGASEDTALEVAMASLKREAFLKKLGSLRARGKTPLARSLLEAAGDLRGATKDRPVTAVLLTDGGEDTLSKLDPLEAAEAVGKLQGVSLEIVGFDIGREDWSRQLERMAERSGGRYWPARDASSLLHDLRRAALGVPDGFTVLDAGGREVARGAFGESRELPEGKYRLVASVGPGSETAEDVWINTDRVTSVVFRIAPPGEAGETKTPPRFCTGCGKPLSPPFRFCSHCGKKVGA